MNLFAFLVLLVLTAVWLVLPLVPALREFFRPTDIEPLTMVGRDNADIARFARNFREYLKGQLAQLQGEPDARGEQTGKFADNTPFMRLARLPTGAYELMTTTAGLPSDVRQIAIEPNRTARETVVFKFGRISIVTRPAGATVLVTLNALRLLRPIR